MPTEFEHSFDADEFRLQLKEHGCDISDIPGSMFRGFKILVDRFGTSAQHEDKAIEGFSDEEPPIQELSDSEFRVKLACNTARFAGAKIVHDLDDKEITHVLAGDNQPRLKEIREQMAK